jgi:hypothetical protein
MRQQLGHGEEERGAPHSATPPSQYSFPALNGVKKLPRRLTERDIAIFTKQARSPI